MNTKLFLMRQVLFFSAPKARLIFFTFSSLLDQ
jgi:hypothetical protein